MNPLALTTSGLQSSTSSGYTASPLIGVINPSLATTPFFYIGTTLIELNRASAAQALTGITSIDGSASTWTTARLLAGNSVNGSINVPFANKFIVQGVSDSGLSGAQFLGALATGIIKNTFGTGILSIAVAGDFPVLNQNTTGTAQYATNIASGISNEIPYQVTPGVTGFITPLSNALLVTNGSNIPSLSATIPAGVSFAGNIDLPASLNATQGNIKIFGEVMMHAFSANHSNLFLGWQCGNYSLTTGSAIQNYTLGQDCLRNLTTGSHNFAGGFASLDFLTTGLVNVGIGDSCLYQLLTGSYNLGFGYQAGYNYTGAESSNILFHNIGVLGESNVIRIGTQGTGNAQQNKFFAAGIYNTAVGATAGIALVDSAHQIGGLSGAANTMLIGGTKPSFVSSIPSTIISNSNIALINVDNAFSAVQSLNAGVQFATVGGTPAVLNDCEDQSGDMTFAGIWAADQIVAVYIYKIGKEIQLKISPVNATANTSAVVSVTGTIESRFRPNTNGGNVAFFPIWVIDAGGYVLGNLAIDGSTGSITIYVGFNSAFTGSGNSGWPAINVSYISAS